MCHLTSVAGQVSFDDVPSLSHIGREPRKEACAVFVVVLGEVSKPLELRGSLIAMP